jgi:hypothetical protein
MKFFLPVQDPKIAEESYQNIKKTTSRCESRPQRRSEQNKAETEPKTFIRLPW